MRQGRGYHILFAVALITLFVLGGWWGLFFMRQVEFERRAGLSELRHNAAGYAMELGRRSAPPTEGPINEEFEVVRARAYSGDELLMYCLPLHSDFGVRLTAKRIAALDERLARRRLMVIGESTLLFIMLAVCTFMLYRLVRQERRHTAAIRDFVAAVTHEMKTPLAGLKSMLQTFAAGRVPVSEAPSLFAMGLKETERLEHMVENILLAGRLRTVGYEVQREPVDVLSLLDEFLVHRRASLVGREESLELESSAPPRCTALADPRALRVILENLTDNAFKYGGRPAEVRLSLEERGPRLVIGVSDNGIGFTRAAAERMFEPFGESAASAHAGNHGTGLGLTISLALAQRMGATLEAKSKGPGQGSYFALSLERGS